MSKSSDHVIMPGFSLFSEEGKSSAPWHAPVLATCKIGNVTFRVERNRAWKARKYWLSASHDDGFRAAATMRTSSEKVAKKWIAAVKSGNISVEKDSCTNA